MRTADTRSLLYELGTLYKSGVPVRQSFESLEDSPHGRISRLARRLGGHVDKGATLAEAFRKEEALPPDFIAVIEAGERSGKVTELLFKLVEEFDTRLQMRRRLLISMAYPSVIFVLAILLPPLYKLVLGDFKGYLGKVLGVLIPVALIVALYVVLVRLFRYSRPARRLLEGPLLLTPGLGRIWLTLALGRSLGLFGLLIESGLSLRDSFELVKQTAFFSRLEDGFGDAARFLEKGSSLTESMACLQDIPSSQMQGIRTGEESGTMDEAFQHAGQQLVEAAWSRLDAALKILPVLVYLLVGYFVFLEMSRVLTLGGGMGL